MRIHTAHFEKNSKGNFDLVTMFTCLSSVLESALVMSSSSRDKIPKGYEIIKIDQTVIIETLRK